LSNEEIENNIKHTIRIKMEFTHVRCNNFQKERNSVQRCSYKLSFYITFIINTCSCKIIEKTSITFTSFS
jgi:hypothetical protein